MLRNVNRLQAAASYYKLFNECQQTATESFLKPLQHCSHRRQEERNFLWRPKESLLTCFNCLKCLGTRHPKVLVYFYQCNNTSVVYLLFCKNYRYYLAKCNCKHTTYIIHTWSHTTCLCFSWIPNDCINRSVLFIYILSVIRFPTRRQLDRVTLFNGHLQDENLQTVTSLCLSYFTWNSPVLQQCFRCKCPRLSSKWQLLWHPLQVLFFYWGVQLWWAWFWWLNENYTFVWWKQTSSGWTSRWRRSYCKRHLPVSVWISVQLLCVIVSRRQNTIYCSV